MKIELVLPKYHPKQSVLFSDPVARKVFCIGRRGGKTTGLAIYSVEQFLQGKRIIYGTPVAKQLADYWQNVIHFLRPLNRYLYKNETEKIIRWKGRTGTDQPSIQGQTAYNADTWRGGHGDILILDEFARMDYSVWDQVGAPMLLDTGGTAVFSSTPNRKNHFYQLFTRGLGDDPRWKSYQYTSHDNPHLDEIALQELTEDMSEDSYKQEILAEFLENEGAVFRNIANCTNVLPQNPNDHKGHITIAGTDWAKKQDYHATSIGCLECNIELELMRFNRIDYIYQREMLKSLYAKWGVDWGLAEENAAGDPNIELLIRDGIPVDPFITSPKSKGGLIQGLVLALENEDWNFQESPIARAELESYESTVTATGHIRYNASSGVHDDTVIARALMVRAANSYVPALM